MYRRIAQLLTVSGIVCCLLAITLLGLNLFGNIDISPLILAVFFIGGIMSITFSLAYYTEK